MSDIINLYRERFVESLSELKKKQLYSKNEIKSIIERWTKQEYSLRRVGSNYETYKHAIEQEIEADKELEFRVEKSDMFIEQKKFQRVFKKRIMQLYSRLIRRYPRMLSYYMEYANWCKSIDYHLTAVSVYQRALKYFSRDLSLWNALSQEIIEHNSDIQTARKIMQLGIEINKKSEEGYLCYFKIELNYIHKIKQTIEIRFKDLNKIKDKKMEEENQENNINEQKEIEESLQQLQNNVNKLWKILTIIYTNGIENIDGVEFKSKFIPIIYNEENGQELKKQILHDIINEEKQPKEVILEVLCDTLSPLNKQEALDMIDNDVFKEVSEEKKNKIKNKINGVMEVIKTPVDYAIERIEKVQVEDQIEAMKTEILNINREYLSKLKIYCIDTVMKTNINELNTFIEWVLKTSCDEECYLKIIHYFISQEEIEKAKKVFDEALVHENLAHHSMNLWLEYLLLCRNSNDFKLSQKIKSRMNASYSNPSEVELAFEERINNTN
ncbi:hypothetical protein ENUP19_0042G0036 [Entamoeba nuttalli]|uniref:U3 small nucleolar RNA-associated protein 6 N-terminal domain-containing protein n=1 Tax=Entamoeba nuttalli TaxID=412467 RepID=A0ABQ0DAB1_9EUKA